jgi:hypothetical protein
MDVDVGHGLPGALPVLRASQARARTRRGCARRPQAAAWMAKVKPGATCFFSSMAAARCAVSHMSPSSSAVCARAALGEVPPRFEQGRRGRALRAALHQA